MNPLKQIRESKGDSLQDLRKDLKVSYCALKHAENAAFMSLMWAERYADHYNLVKFKTLIESLTNFKIKT